VHDAALETYPELVEIGIRPLEFEHLAAPDSRRPRDSHLDANSRIFFVPKRE
jgi:hypothetical protein